MFDSTDGSWPPEIVQLWQTGSHLTKVKIPHRQFTLPLQSRSLSISLYVSLKAIHYGKLSFTALFLLVSTSLTLSLFLSPSLCLLLHPHCVPLL